MKVAVAILVVLAACIIFALPAHCAAGNDGNQTGNNTTLNHMTATNSSSHNVTNATQQDLNDTSSDIASDDDLYDYSYSGQYDGTGFSDSDSQIQELLANPPSIGAITGVVLSSVDSRAIPDATVTLYDMDGNLVDIPDNPQLSSSGTGSSAGIYTFTDVPLGQYNVTAEKGGVQFFAIADLRSGTATANVVLPGYVEPEQAYQPPGAPTPAPAPRPLYYFLPMKVGKAPAPNARDEGLPIGLAAVGGASALLLFAHWRGVA